MKRKQQPQSRLNAAKGKHFLEVNEHLNVHFKMFGDNYFHRGHNKYTDHCACSSPAAACAWSRTQPEALFMLFTVSRELPLIPAQHSSTSVALKGNCCDRMLSELHFVS